MTPLERYYKFYNLSGVPAHHLKDQEHYNIYRRPLKEKRSERPKVIVWKENATQQSDLAEMPIDPKGYHYFLVVVEISRRRVDAEPIKNKTANSVLKAFIKIYGRGRIQPPTHRLETDSGSEFTNSQIRDFFLNSIGVMMRFGEPERHKQQSFAERAIQAIEKPLFRRMTAQELKTGETSVEWSEDFHDIVRLVDEQWQRDPPKIPEGPPKIDKNTELLLEGTQVRTKLHEPISVLGKKLHGKFRIGDIKWDPKVRIIKKLILSPEQPPTYLLDGPHGRLGVSRCAYTRKELQVIPINEKPPPDSVIRGRPERYVPERILKHRTRKGQLQYLVKWERYPEDESTWEPADRLQEDVPNLVRIYNDTK
ncbi:DDE-type integrase/transposase/recombinase [Rhizophagus clarus]|uniref:DDE-type integrase/transposase/recombinase n=1 Tax=Rhizophagus clarus TaxID=94130 RepID=A0A8H3M5R2_9GLOM|nr:DDE-type integrase/transposase/recombinase [Rhizophagus clarus]